MAGYQFEKIEIGINLGFFLAQKLDSTALTRQGYTGIKKTQLLVQTVFLIEVSFF